MQVSYHGFPGSMGAELIHSLAADPVSAPPDQAYGARRLFGPARVERLRARVESGRPVDGELLRGLLLGLEGVEDLSESLRVDPAALVDGLVRRRTSAAGGSAGGGGAARATGEAPGRERASERGRRAGLGRRSR